MSSPSNLYAERVFSEHPVALWALDDQVDYLSLINEDSRFFSNSEKWTITDGTAEVYTTVVDEPFSASNVSKIIGDTPTGAIAEVTAISSNILNSSSFNQDLDNFCIGIYLYSLSQYIQSTSIGYEYTDPETLETVQILKSFDTTFPEAWLFLSETFPLPITNVQIRLVLKITYSNGIYEDDNTFAFLTNGLTLGQWSEDFNSASLGSTKIDIPENIPTAMEFGIEAKAYGLQESNGYYLINNNKLFAKNNGVPMVYGSGSITSITPNNGGIEPSLILPGQGFLNQAGQYKEYTAEMWLRVNSYATTPKRIFGPIASSDGLYVDGPFLTLKIGTYNKSHPIAEWYRPMLVQIKVINNLASLVINGETVFSIDIITSELELPAEYAEDNTHQDWIAFYAYEDVRPVEIDSAGLYPYNLPDVMAKRRFVYGQGVEFPEPSNTAYGGTSALIDYESARYANNYNYPGIGSWGQGISDNVLTVNRQLSVPKYTLPQFIFVSRAGDQLVEDSQTLQLEETDNFINLRPTEDWDEENGYLIFNSLNVLLDEEKSFFGVFKKSESVSQQILFKLADQSTSNSLTIMLDDTDIIYRFKYNGTEQTIHTQENYVVDENEKFIVGMDIDKFSKEFGSNVRYFLADRNRLKLYIGGDETFSKTFTGNIYRIAISNNRNILKKYGEDEATLKSAFDSNGLFRYIESDYFSNFVASYTLVPQLYLDKFILDIATDSYWEDYVPLQKMAKYVKDSSNKSVYSIDFLQINFDYPEPQIVENSYDVQNSLLRAFITFQLVQSGASAVSSNFINIESVPINGVVTPGTNWLNTKYEIINGTIVYPPAGVPIESLAINIHFDFNFQRIISNPLRVKRLEIAAQALNSISSTEIGTKYGEKLFPYTKSGVYFNYKNKNPYKIYKGKNPYFYLNRTSGIRLVGDYVKGTDRGISLKINAEKDPEYEVIALQMAINYDAVLPGELSRSVGQPIFEIQGKRKYIKFLIENVGGRGRIKAIDAQTNTIENSIVFYLNGKLVRNPFIEPNQWNILGISFANPINVNSYTGGLRITGPIMVNNISHYKLIDFQSITQIRTRPWSDVKMFGDTPLDWQFWFPAYNWGEVLVIASSTTYVVNPKTTYQIYTGTNKIIVDDDRATVIRNYQYSLYNNVTWQTSILPAV